jgi:hypothetical protein
LHRGLVAQRFEIHLATLDEFVKQLEAQAKLLDHRLQFPIDCELWSAPDAGLVDILAGPSSVDMKVATLEIVKP